MHAGCYRQQKRGWSTRRAAAHAARAVAALGAALLMRGRCHVLAVLVSGLPALLVAVRALPCLEALVFLFLLLRILLC